MNYFTGLLKLNTFGEQAILYLSCGVLSTLAASTCTNISYITEWIPNDVKILWLHYTENRKRLKSECLLVNLLNEYTYHISSMLFASCNKEISFLSSMLSFYHIETTAIQDLPEPFDSWEWLVSNFSLQYHPWIKHWGHENKGNDQDREKPLIERAVWRICMLMKDVKS